MKLMLAVDATDDCDQVVQAAARWAARLSSTLDLVYASEGNNKARDRLETLRRDHLPQGICGEIRIVLGRPLDVLPIATEGYDAALIATHGRPGLARAVLGSVADRLVRSARCPVCVMPLNGRMEPAESDRVLVTTDRSLSSVHAAQWGLALLKPRETHALHVVTAMPGETAAALLDNATAEVRSFLDERGLNIDEVHVKTSGYLNPADAVVALAEKIDASAILTAARGANAVPALGIGSVTGRLLHLTRIPVWVLHG